ncbi:MAG: hypothetical protein PHU99_09975 [Candidatus Cloacimonetes bacterium]|nr:hypothetical protein [Candidatus Cloacimonadota bacterium]MDY0336712.1 hypothetical protein [Candidatus Cloacimonadaceae bacterium]MCK9335306.1 hypothetical protein [Candidatus Cloacimonadota bacterium]MDD2683922.1 hypothetical protein [Candidatus Cloacimonadota bacterium]MDD3098034.1 hypothetical protein [Candidatus Cloacimonadota bacterium]
MKYTLGLIVLLMAVQLASIVVIDTNGINHEYAYETFFKLQPGEFSTSREKDGVLNTQNWTGIRFDKWMAEQKLGDFARIKFLSKDRYEVSFSKVEWDTLSCWLAYAEGGKTFPKQQFRIIFPFLREMHWVRDLDRVVLENEKDIAIPRKVFSFANFFQHQELINDPKPFKRMQGYSLDLFLGELSEKPVKDIILYSADDLIQNLIYPSQLSGAVMELTEDGKYNLKSPQIPGGMWMKDIVYLQCDNSAIINLKYISKLIPIAKTLAWDLSPEVRVVIDQGTYVEELSFADALSEPMLLESAEYFEIIP